MSLGSTIVSLTGADTIIIDDRVITDFADADNAKLSFPNELAALKTGKNGNTIYAFNEMGRMVEVTLRLIRGSEDDKYLNSRLAEMKADFAAFELLSGNFVKRVGDGTGFVTDDNYIVDGGVFTKQPDATSNVEGDTEQSISLYTLRFANGDRSLF